MLTVYNRRYAFKFAPQVKNDLNMLEIGSGLRAFDPFEGIETDYSQALG